ncbi:F0F1 ATP synthase subunit B [Flavimaricola marinus]|uniref:ATP synthase subunit b n=1 Tax=Flavimaricola marinus TaxID=1819565 RepID=A0A238L9W8_9RHOB|nr:F0F1 ATP synthase subunit B [Flavimaricola marinus]SMY06214.1 ATP synthase subunit b precursor [Flavimaricola marinus]
MRHLKAPIAALAALSASPALAAGDVFFSLKNTDFVVSIAFLVFVGILLYFKVPSLVGGMLDKRAEGIKSELDEARGLREEAQALLASFERKQKDVQDQADRIVANARDEAARAAEQAKVDIRTSVDRRMKAAEEQIASAQSAAVKDVRDRAVTAAIAAAQNVIASQMSASDANALIDDAIAQVEAKLH